MSRIIDWDLASLVPLRLTAQPLEDILFPAQIIRAATRRKVLNETQEDEFVAEVQALEKTISPGGHVAQLFADADINAFLYNALVTGNVSTLRELNVWLWREATEKTPQAMESARWLWKAVVKNFEENNRPVPDWPLFIEMQEGLELRETNLWSRIKRGVERIRLKGLLALMDNLPPWVPKNDWVEKRHCYLRAMFAEKWEFDLPSGKRGHEC